MADDLEVAVDQAVGNYRTKGNQKKRGPFEFDVNDHHFVSLEFVPGSKLMAMTYGAMSGNVLPYFEDFLGPQESDRLIAVLDDPEEEVDEVTVTTIWGDLFRHYTGRPTRRPSNLNDGRPTTPITSAEGSSSPGETPTESPIGTVSTPSTP